MANDNQTQMPSGQGGLVRYFESDTGIELDPKVVIGLTSMVIVFELALHMGIFTA